MFFFCVRVCLRRARLRECTRAPRVCFERVAESFGLPASQSTSRSDVWRLKSMNIGCRPQGRRHKVLSEVSPVFFAPRLAIHGGVRVALQSAVYIYIYIYTHIYIYVYTYIHTCVLCIYIYIYIYKYIGIDVCIYH